MSERPLFNPKGALRSNSWERETAQEKTELIQGILELFTPNHILEQTEFIKPEVIVPWNYPNFDALLMERERIRNLQLVPVKNDAQYAHYHAQSKEKLISSVEGFLGESSLALAPNLFPYYLSDDVQQNILWMKDKNTDKDALATFLATYMKQEGLSLNEVIFFERPLKTTSPLVKGTMPEYRHMHVWTRGAI